MVAKRRTIIGYLKQHGNFFKSVLERKKDDWGRIRNGGRGRPIRSYMDQVKVNTGVASYQGDQEDGSCEE